MVGPPIRIGSGKKRKTALRGEYAATKNIFRGTRKSAVPHGGAITRVDWTDGSKGAVPKGPSPK